MAGSRPRVSVARRAQATIPQREETHRAGHAALFAAMTAKPAVRSGESGGQWIRLEMRADHDRHCLPRRGEKTILQVTT